MTPAVAVLWGRSASDGTSPRRNPPHSTLRQATPEDAPAIYELMTRHLDEGHLLPRRLEEIAVHTSRFVVAVAGPAHRLRQGSGGQEAGHYVEEIVGCADLAPLSHRVAEIRSLVVARPARSIGAGRRLIDTIIVRARAAGFERLCAFTHAPSYFVRQGFSIVPHEWLPEKISADCGTCPLFRACGQYAVTLRLGPPQGGHYRLHG